MTRIPFRKMHGAGNDFVVLDRRTADFSIDAAGAAAIAETIRLAVYDLHIDHARSPFGRVTVSIGLVTSRENATRNDMALVRMADAALYRAKSAGRNRVCRAPEA